MSRCRGILDSVSIENQLKLLLMNCVLTGLVGIAGKKLKKLQCEDGEFEGVASHVTDATSSLRPAHSSSGEHHGKHVWFPSLIEGGRGWE